MIPSCAMSPGPNPRITRTNMNPSQINREQITDRSPGTSSTSGLKNCPHIKSRGKMGHASLFRGWSPQPAWHRFAVFWRALDFESSSANGTVP